MTPQITLLISISGVIGGLIGVMLNNVVNVWLQDRRQRNEERAEGARTLCAKGEALVLALESFATSFRGTVSDISMALLDQSRKHPVECADFLKANEQMVIVNMLTRIYFPSSVAALEAIEAQRLSLSKLALRLVNSRKSISDDEKTATELVRVGLNVAESVGTFERQILDAVHAVQATPVVK